MKEHNADYLLMHEYLNMPVLWLSSEHEIDNFNRAAEITFGWYRDHVLGKKIMDFFRFDEAFDHNSCFCRQETDTVTPTQVHNKFLDKNGQQKKIQWLIIPVYDDNATYKGATAYAKRIIDEVIAEEVTFNDVKLDELFLHMPGYIYWKDTRSEYVGCNYNLARISGLKHPSEIIGKKDEDFGWGHEDAEAFRRDDQKVMRTGILNVTEYELPVKRESDSRNLVVRTEKLPLYNRSGDVVGILGVALDITDQKVIEQMLMEAKESAEKQVQLLTKLRRAQDDLATMRLLSGSLSHELKTPLAGIRLGLGNIIKPVNQLIEHYKLTHEQTDITINDKVLSNTQEVMPKLVNRVDMGNAIIQLQMKNISVDCIDKNNFQSCSMKMILDEAIDDYPFIDSQKGQLNYSVTTDFKFLGEPVLTRHIIWNLVHNALHYLSQEPDGKLSISIEEKPAGYDVIFHDTGPGIPKDKINTIFDKFYTTRASGAGLGLAFCKTVMQAFGGDILCSSKEDKYAQFILHFPKAILLIEKNHATRK